MSQTKFYQAELVKLRNEEVEMDSRKLKHQQGSYDGLCGVYATITSAQQMANGKLTKAHCERLFRDLVDEMERRGLLAGAVREGLYFRELGKILDQASAFLENEIGAGFSRHVASNSSATSLSAFWQLLEAHTEEHGPSSVILGMGGPKDHWTCVKRVTDKSLELEDSGERQRIYRSMCTTSDSYGRRQTVLWPTQTYLLRRA